MDPVVLGLATALCWGGADFAARFVGRAVGALMALTAVTVAGAIELSLAMTVAGLPLPRLAAASGWAWAATVATTLSLLMFYEALRRAPLVVVAPLVGAYPAWALLIAIAALDVRPPAETWIAILAVLAGMPLVARDGAGPPTSRLTLALAVGAGMLFAVAVLLGQQSSGVHGELATVWYTRVFGGGLLIAALLALPRPRLPLRWAAVAAGQGVADTAGYLFLYSAAAGLGGAVATVVSSTFGIVVVLLARLILRESVRAPQWLGMALVFGGIVGLSA